MEELESQFYEASQLAASADGDVVDLVSGEPD